MKKLHPIAAALVVALLVLPAAALTQQEMLARYRASAQPMPHRYHGCYRDGMLLRAEYVPSPTSGRTLALACTAQGCRLDDGLPDDTPVRAKDEFLLRIYCIAADGSRMGFLQLRVKADGSVLRAVFSSQPGDYVRQAPFVFQQRGKATRVSWRFEGGEFRRLCIDYGRKYLSGVEYDASGKTVSLSIIPSLYPEPPTNPSPPPVEFEGEFEPAAPVLDMSGVDGELGGK